MSSLQPFFLGHCWKVIKTLTFQQISMMKWQFKLVSIQLNLKFYNINMHTCGLKKYKEKITMEFFKK